MELCGGANNHSTNIATRGGCGNDNNSHGRGGSGRGGFGQGFQKVGHGGGGRDNNFTRRSVLPTLWQRRACNRQVLQEIRCFLHRRSLEKRLLRADLLWGRYQLVC
jgi:hypothetical protein